MKGKLLENAWVSEEGKILELDSPYEHLSKACELFPDSPNPEKELEEKGWIKVSSGKVLWYKDPNQRQVDALFEKVSEEEFRLLLLSLRD